MKYSPHDSPILIEARLENDSLAVSIADEGDGISDTRLGHVFDKFDRAGRTGETGGVGLGLSICRGLVDAHRGTIAIRRRRPRGTEVMFTLPPANREAAA